MSVQLDEPLTPELRDTLINLATGLFGLDAWIKEPGKYVPPIVDPPWRVKTHTFTPADLGVLSFFENLLRESSQDDDLGSRWAAVMADPLRFSPLADPAEWRRNRGLNSAPKFGIVGSSNIWLTDPNGRVISRATFYSSCWPLLNAVVTARRQTGPPVDWAALAKDLLAGSAPQWPTTSRPGSAAFLIQFAADMLYAMLGIRNPAPEPWRRAVLIELGEYRKPGGNKGEGFTRKDTDTAVEVFRETIGLDAVARVEAKHGKR